MQKKFWCAMAAVMILSAVLCMLVLADDTALTRKESCYLLVDMLEGRANVIYNTKSFDDIYDLKISKAQNYGLVFGYPNDYNFYGGRKVTTQEFFIMLKRAMDRAAPNLIYDNTKIRHYTDEAAIASYARSPITMLTAVGVLEDSMTLNPYAPISKEKAVKYISLAVNAIENGVKSTPGVMPKKKVPVLMYHTIDYPQEATPYKYVFVHPENFEEQIKYLSENGYTFLFPEELSYADQCEKPVVITFDDGYENNYLTAYPILQKYNAKATIYMISSLIGTPYYCKDTQLQDMSRSGTMRIYSHSASHKDLSSLSEEEVIREMSDSNDKIYNITRRDVVSMAYPYGKYNDTVLKQARRFYRNAFSVMKGDPYGLYNKPRVTIDNKCDLSYFKKLLEVNSK